LVLDGILLVKLTKGSPANNRLRPKLHPPHDTQLHQHKLTASIGHLLLNIFNRSHSAHQLTTEWRITLEIEKAAWQAKMP
jgi:hypothetical protein